jgi:hypothetical protein
VGSSLLVTVNRYKLHPLPPTACRGPREISAPLVPLQLVIVETTLDVEAAEVIVAFDVADDTTEELVVAETVDDSFEVFEVLETVEDTTGVLVTAVILDDVVVELGVEAA